MFGRGGDEVKSRDEHGEGTIVKCGNCDTRGDLNVYDRRRL